MSGDSTFYVIIVYKYVDIEKKYLSIVFYVSTLVFWKFEKVTNCHLRNSATK